MIAAATTIPAAPCTCAAIARPLADILAELRSLLPNVGEDRYCMRMGPLFANSTIGGHIRHCLDHARALLDGRELGVVDYDHRLRGTDIETSPTAADAELASLIAAANRLSTIDADEEISVLIMPARDGQAIDLRSTLGRELAFVLSHTIHHNATVRGMVVSLGLPVPDSLGYAPSTLAHQDSSRCAR